MWSGLSLAWLLRGTDRVAEADIHLSEVLAAAEALGDHRLLSATLALGCDLSAELGQAQGLSDRLRLRATLASQVGEHSAQLNYLYQAFMASFRARLVGSGSLGEEFAEALLGSNEDWGEGLDLQECVRTLVAAEAPAHAQQVALRLSQRAFRSGRRRDAASWLVETARLSRSLRDLPQANEMLDEAIQISKAYRLGMHSEWEKERAIWAEDVT